MTRFPGFLKVLFIIFLAACAADAATLAEALPPDVYAFVDIPNMPAARAAGGHTAYGDILAESDMERFLDSGFPALTTLRSDFRSSAGRSFRQILDFCKGEAAFAVVPDVNKPAAVVMILNVGKDKKEVEAFLSDLETRTGLWTSLEIPGASVRTSAFGPVSLSYALADDYLMASTSIDCLASVTSGIMSGRKQNLAGESAYVKCRALSTLKDPEVLAYVNVNLIMSRLTPSMSDTVSAMLKESGLETVGGAFFACRSEGKGFLDEVVFHFPTGREGLFASVRPSQDEGKTYLSMIPADAMNASWSSMELSHISDVCSACYNAIPPDNRVLMDEFLSKVEASTNVSLKADIFESLGRNVVSYTPTPSQLMGLGLYGGIGQQVILVELKDKERFEKSVNAVWEYAKAELDKEAASPAEKPAPPASSPKGPSQPVAFQPSLKLLSEQFGTHTIYQIRIILNPSIQIVPSFAIKDNWLIIAGDTFSVKDALGAPLVFKPNLLNNPDYLRAAKIVGPGNAGLSYTNTRVFFDAVYPMMAFGIPFVLAQVGGNMPADQLFLPPAQAISPHLFGSAASVSATPDSIRMISYGPIGFVRTVYAGGVAGAAIAKWFVELRQEPAPAPAPARLQRKALPASDDLRTLANAISQFAGNTDGRYPKDEAQLRAILDRSTNRSTAILERYRYISGLSSSDDERIVVAFDRFPGANGRRVLLVGGEIMNLTDGEVGESVGGWLNLPRNPSDADMDKACLENLKAIAASVKHSAESHSGAVPAKLDLRADYRFNPLILTCPSDAAPEGPDYATVTAINIDNVPESSKADIVLVYETSSRHQDRPGVAFLDGAVKRLTPKELQAAIDRTKSLAR